tara:strand:- start:146540 stop:147085 length:546 start_codon:yes stop_codon:yes gene_type:complete
MSLSLLATVNQASGDTYGDWLQGCCGSRHWCRLMSESRPIASTQQWHEQADAAFDRLSSQDWIEAFESHPKIGDVDSLRMKFAGNDKWSGHEQSGVADASEDVVERLANANEVYQRKFGYIFIVCATGKTASEMLDLLDHRIRNDALRELEVAAAEQRKITHLRIDKLIAELSASETNPAE